MVSSSGRQTVIHKNNANDLISCKQVQRKETRKVGMGNNIINLNKKKSDKLISNTSEHKSPKVNKMDQQGKSDKVSRKDYK